MFIFSLPCPAVHPCGVRLFCRADTSPFEPNSHCRLVVPLQPHLTGAAQQSAQHEAYPVQDTQHPLLLVCYLFLRRRWNRKILHRLQKTPASHMRHAQVAPRVLPSSQEISTRTHIPRTRCMPMAPETKTSVRRQCGSAEHESRRQLGPQAMGLPELWGIPAGYHVILTGWRS